MLLPRFDVRSWRQINYRSTDSLLAAEFLHGLFNRHDPFLNPYRFCNTIVVFKDWSSTSYAPRKEWDLLGARFGGRLLREWSKLEPELKRVLSRERIRSISLARDLAEADFDAMSNMELADRLAELHHTPLGEIYEVNLVQVEHALSVAIVELIKEELGVSTEQAHAEMAERLTGVDATCAGEEEMAWLRFVLDTMASSHQAHLDRRLERWWESIHSLGTAYGAEEMRLETLRHRYHEYKELGAEDLERRLQHGRRTDARRATLPEGELLCSLVGWARKTGSVRDKNKEILGRVMQHRGPMLASIARRRNLDTESVRLYLLEELIALLESGVAVPQPVLRQRLREGVVFQRRESMAGIAALPSSLVTGEKADGQLTGLCASPGLYSGRVSVVRRADDLQKMKMGDVLVAPGTDFDLVPHLCMAGAIVTEEGGFLSHASVIAREREVPCVIGVAKASSVLEDGMILTVDGTQGRITIIDRARTTEAVGSSRRPTGFGHVERLEEQTSPDRCGAKAWRLLQLHRMGFPTPTPAFVIPTETCEQARAGQGEVLTEIAREILGWVGPQPLNLRSSSPLEDRDTGSAAGVYRSNIGVEANEAAMASALREVLDSARAPAAVAYHGDSYRSSQFAVLVTGFRKYDLQGVARSKSPWSFDHVAVEVHDDNRSNELPDRGALYLHVRRDRAEASAAHGSPPSPWRRLCEVARWTLRVEMALQRTVEIEWGLEGDRVVVLQARPIADRGVPSRERPRE